MKKILCRSLSLLAALCLITQLTGCATSFKGDELSGVKSFPPITLKKSVKVELLFSGKLNGKPWKNNDAQNTAYLKDQCIDQLNASGMFGAVSSNAKTSDLNIQVAIINEKTSDDKKEFVSFCTLFLYPYKTSDSFRLLAIVKDTRTGESKRILLESSVNYYQQLLLTPLALFKSHDRGLDACRERLFDHLCLEIQKAGFLD